MTGPYLSLEFWVGFATGVVFVVALFALVVRSKDGPR